MMPKGVDRSLPPLPERFWTRVSKGEPDQCWEWLGYKARNGYGKLGVQGRKTVSAHRYAYEVTFGAIPDGLQIDHVCGNRACVNPAHLRPATDSENHCNTKLLTSNTSGLKGASWSADKGKWLAQIVIRNVHHFLGYFATAKEAHATYCRAAERLHGEFANFGYRKARPAKESL